MVISGLRIRVSGFYHVAWFRVSAAVVVVWLVDGVFIVITKLESGTYFIETGGFTVFFREARKSKFGDGYYELIGLHGSVVAAVFPHDKGFKTRVRELKKIGLIE